MFLKQRSDGSLVELISATPLFDPFEAHVMGRFHAGEELQEEEQFAKADLGFVFGEPLPRCWLDPAYQLHQKSTCA